MIRITRVRPYSELLRSYKIFIDGTCRGRIGVDETLEFEVENGEHTVYAKIDFYKSNILCINVDNSIVGWRRLFYWVYMTFLARKQLWLREKAVDTTSGDTK